MIRKLIRRMSGASSENTQLGAGRKKITKRGVDKRAYKLTKERIEDLIESGDGEIVSNHAIEGLFYSPWDTNLLELLAETKSGPYRDLIFTDILRKDPAKCDIFEFLLGREADYFLRREINDIETLFLRLERIVVSERHVVQDFVVPTMIRILNGKYKEDPFRIRGVALCFVKIVAKFSDEVCLRLFDGLRRNMIDDRIKRVVYGSSKRLRHHFSCLDLVDCVEDKDERDYERNSILNEILGVFFSRPLEEIESLLCDINTSGTGNGNFQTALEKISPYSEKIFLFLENNAPTIEELPLDQKISFLRKVLSDEYQEGKILSFGEYEISDFFDDLTELPLYTIQNRIRDEIKLNSEFDMIFSKCQKIVSSHDASHRRKVEIILSVAGETRKTHKKETLDFLEMIAGDVDTDERLSRLISALYEENGRLDEALQTLERTEQPSSIKRLSRLTQIKHWMEHGYRIDHLGDFSENYIPNKMNILYNVHSSLPYKTSGYTIRTREVVSNLKSAGFDISVNVRWGFPLDRDDVSNEEKERVATKFCESGIEYTFTPDPEGMRVWKDEEFSKKASEQILSLARKTRPMAIMSASDATIGLASAMAAKSLGVPFIYEMRGLWAMTRAANNPEFYGSTKYDLMMRLERQCALEAHRVVTISDKMRQLVASWGVDKSKIILLPNGVSNSETERKVVHEKRTSGLNCGYLGSIVHYEGLETLVKAAKELQTKGIEGIRFTIVGDGKERPQIEELASELGVHGLVEIRGNIPNDQVAKFYEEIDCIVLPRLGYDVCEMVPALKPLEAMSNGKCVISSDIGPARELITDREDGLLFKTGDTDSLIEKLVEIRDDPGFMEKMAENGREMAMTDRNWPKLLSELSEELIHLQILRESRAKLPRTNEMKDVVLNYVNYSENGEVDKIFSMFSDLILKTRGSRMRRNCFLIFLRALGEMSPDYAVKFFFEYEEFADKRSVRSSITYARRNEDIDNVHLLIRRYSRILDEDFIKRFERITARYQRKKSGIFVWPSHEEDLNVLRPKVACILDRFSFDCLKYEFDLHPIPRSNYEDFFDSNNFDFVFMESFWASHNDEWRFAMSSNDSPMGEQLNKLIKYVKDRGLKTVFWNKEDPINYDIFIQSAKKFDYIFTSDSNIIPKYVEDCGHDRIYPLEFACEPRLHNPIRNRLEEKDLSFAGAWYERVHDNRKEQMRILLDSSTEYELDIYDRFFDDNSPNKFPAEYQRFVRGSLTYDEARSTYRMYKAVLNVNTIQDSPTMFSRRVYEVLASSTYVISTPSIGVEALKHGVSVVKNREEARKEISRILEDKLYREREAHLGYRKVMTEDTYRERVNFICQKIGFNPGSNENKPMVSLVCVTNRPEMIENIVSNFKRQVYPNLELILCLTANNPDYKLAKTQIKDSRIKLLRVGKSLKLGTCLNKGFGRARGDYIGKFDDDDFYGKNYVSDQMIAFKYSGADIVGKTSIFMYNGHDETIYRRYPQSSHKVLNLVLGPTLLMKREVFDTIKFRDLGLGEDTTFLRDAAEYRYRIYATDPYNFMYIRRADSGFHSWNPEQDELLKGAEKIGKFDNWEDLVDI